MRSTRTPGAIGKGFLFSGVYPSGGATPLGDRSDRTGLPDHPAPGYRESGVRGTSAGGTLYYIGYSGYSWSSTIPSGSTNAHHLDFYYGGINPNYTHSRAYGLQLRCLQE